MPVQACLTASMLAGVVGSMLIGGSASGGEVTRRVLESPHPGTTLEQLNEDELRAYFEHNRPVGMELSERQAASASAAFQAAGTKCWTPWREAESKSAAGLTAYRWWQGLKWCGKDGSITSWKVFDRGGTTSMPGWSYRGNSGQGAYNVDWEVRQYTQENFEFGIKDYGYTTNPCIQIRGGATGLYSARVTCTLG